ncbi:unnamed protein product [Rhizoctonia solani]|uniref:ABM domain-containing protein n=1 Tax=Rhizoctonia solani TaxID=456999 RepID=A0A8H3I486_9AGAM|nr:unnamed protein product [Rhizoctonia solani]
MADSFEHFTGKVIVHALFTAEDGHADELAKALKSVQEYALSDKEPGKSALTIEAWVEILILYASIGCLTYRVNRSGNQFLIFEEYANAAAITEHRTTPPYVAIGELSKSKPLVVPGSRKVTFYEEV